MENSVSPNTTLSDVELSHNAENSEFRISQNPDLSHNTELESVLPPNTGVLPPTEPPTATPIPTQNSPPPPP